MAQPLPLHASTVGRVTSYLGELWRRREFAIYLAMGNLKARNASTTLGLFWWVLNPLLLAAIYFLVFGVIYGGNRGENYIGYLVSGMFVFHFTALSLTGGANSILQNRKLLVNLNFPRLILPVAGLIESGVGFAVSLGTLYVLIGPIQGTWPGPSLWILLVIVPLHLLMNLGLAALAARLAVPFRDVKNLLPYLSRLWLYLSPVIWPLSFLDTANETIQTMIRLNPMFYVLEVYRSALLGTPATFDSFLIAAVWSIGVCVVGVSVFVRNEGHMARYL